MFNKEIIDSKCTQIIDIINNFVSVFRIPGKVKIALGTNFNNKNQYLLSLTIGTDTYNFEKDLLFPGEFRRIIYDKVFWSLFNKYIDNDNINLEKNMDVDSQLGNTWQVIIHNKSFDNYVIVEYAIENTKDFIWISSAFEKWDNVLRQRKIKNIKLENK